MAVLDVSNKKVACSLGWCKKDDILDAFTVNWSLWTDVVIRWFAKLEVFPSLFQKNPIMPFENQFVAIFHV